MDTDLNRPQGATQGRPHQPARPGTVAPLNTDPEPLPVAAGVGSAAESKRITAFGKGKRHEDSWSRTPNTTGLGAVHVKSFHGKLTDDALAYMDQCINEWLDSHPQYEVKFVTSTVGMLTGKLQEPHLICQVWV
jgi:hypothetical protein